MLDTLGEVQARLAEVDGRLAGLAQRTTALDVRHQSPECIPPAIPGGAIMSFGELIDCSVSTGSTCQEPAIGRKASETNQSTYWQSSDRGSLDR